MKRVLFTIVAAVSCSIIPLQATPVTYSLTTTASGTLGGTSFTNAQVTVTLTGDTANVKPGPAPDTDVLVNSGSATVTVSGVGTGAFTDSIVVISSLNNTTLLGVPTVLILDNTTGTGILFQAGSVFATYDLRGSLGPIAGTGGVASGSHVTPIFPTTAGNLTWAVGLPSGTSTFTASVNSIVPTSALGPVSVFPPAVSASTQQITFSYNDPRGAADLGVVNILINNFLDGRHACYLAYSQPSNVLYLVGDDGGTLSAGAVLTSSGSTSNSQCAISWGSGAVAAVGNILTLTLTITANAVFAGNKVVYMAAGDASQNNSGWIAMGVWQVPGATPVATTGVTGMSPANGGGLGPTPFTFNFSDSKGYRDLGVVNILVNNFLDGRHACYLAYSQPANTLYLVDDAGDAGGPFAASAVLNAAGSIQNSQCAVSWGSAPVTASGNSLTLALNIAFTAAFTGNRIFYLAARDAAGANNTDWQTSGTWTVRTGSIVYSASGAFSGATPSTAFSAPNKTWAFSFQADSNPQVLAFGNGGLDLAFSNFSYSLNGSPVAITPTTIRFFTAANGGGFFLCFGAQPCGNGVFPNGLGTGFGAPQLYSGLNSAPTLLPGSFTVPLAVTVNSTPSNQGNTTLSAVAGQQ